MNLKVGKQELFEKLSDIQNIVEKRNTMPVLSHFLLDAKKKGAFIQATDLETAIKEPVELVSGAEVKLCIPARKFFEIIREVEGDITIETEDSGWIRVRAGLSSFRLACLPPEEFPQWPAMAEAEEFQAPAPLLGEMLEKTIYASGESDTRYTLNGLLFHLTPQGLTVVGTDGHRMAVISKPLESPLKEEKKVIIPRKAASELRRVLEKDGTVSVLVGKNHVLFKVADVEFLTRLIEGTYPNYTQVIPASNDKKCIVEREGFIKALRRVSVMSRERSNAVKADISEGGLRLSSSNPDLGEASDELPADYKGEPLTTGYNARYLLDALNALSSEKVSLELTDPLSPTLLRAEGDEDYRCVVMPMRI